MAQCKLSVNLKPLTLRSSETAQKRAAPYFYVSALASPSHQRPHIMQTAPLHLRHASSGQYGWASEGFACASGTSTVLRGLRVSVLAKGIRAALLVSSLKSGCVKQRGFGRVKSAAVCTGTALVWGEGGAPTAVATASVRPNPALNRSAVSSFGLRLVGRRARLAQR